jgi:hypothetical protein
MLAKQNQSLELLETRESLGTFETFLNDFLGNSPILAFLDRARPLREASKELTSTWQI